VLAHQIEAAEADIGRFAKLYPMATAYRSLIGALF
jgi:hypothetical protein